MANKHWYAFGNNVLVKVRDPKYSEGGIELAPQSAADNIKPEGKVMSCGSLVEERDYLNGKHVCFNPDMVQYQLSDENDDTNVFVVISKNGILAVDDGENLPIQ